MNRPRGFCACCGLQIEFYNDHLTPQGMNWRCGNCFEGYSEDQVGRLNELQKKIEAADQGRAKLLADFLTTR